MRIAEVRERLLGSRLEPRVLQACLAVTDVLAKVRKGDGHYLGIPFFMERIEDAALRTVLLPALSILSTREGAILEMHGYLDDAATGQLHLDEQEFRDLITTGELAHPTSGDLVEDPFNQVHIYYSLREDVHRER